MDIFTFVIFKNLQFPIFLSSYFVQPNPNGYNTCICKAHSTTVKVINTDAKYFF